MAVVDSTPKSLRSSLISSKVNHDKRVRFVTPDGEDTTDKLEALLDDIPFDIKSEVKAIAQASLDDFGLQRAIAMAEGKTPPTVMITPFGGIARPNELEKGDQSTLCLFTDMTPAEELKMHHAFRGPDDKLHILDGAVPGARVTAQFMASKKQVNKMTVVCCSVKDLINDMVLAAREEIAYVRAGDIVLSKHVPVDILEISREQDDRGCLFKLKRGNTVNLFWIIYSVPDQMAQMMQKTIKILLQHRKKLNVISSTTSSR